MQTLDQNSVTQYILQKHHLLDSSQAKNVLQAVNDIIALHATSVGTPYISLFARMKNFQRNHLDEEFYTKRNLLRLRAMRSTLFITSSESAPMLFQATKLSENELLSLTQKWGIPPLEYRTLYERVHNSLKGGGKTLLKIRKALPKELIRTVELKEGKSVYRWTNLKWVLAVMMRLGVVISEKDAGALRITEANRYVLFQEIYPKLNLESLTSEEAKAMLIKRYVEAFGSVTEEDIAWWTGFSKTGTKETLAALEKELLSVRISGLEKECSMSEKDYKQFIRFKPLKSHSVLLLPFEDPYTKGYKVRGRLIDPEDEKRAYVGGGVQPTILLDGKIVGTWSRNIEQGKGPIKLTFFELPKKDVKAEAVQKAKAIGRLMADKEINVITD